MAFAFMLPLRAAQGFIALLVLCLSAFVVHDWAPTSYYTWSPAEAQFMLFTSIWTVLILVYLVLAPLHFPTAAHKFAILAAEAVTNIFWFAAWVAMASLLGSIFTHGWAAYRVAVAATVFAAIEWILFMITTVMASAHVYHTRGGRYSNKHDPNMEVRPGV